MTATLPDFHIDDDILFRAKVFDTDGVTLITPTSVVCVVFNAETDDEVQAEDAGIVGFGFAQYNWVGGSATVGEFEAVLTVTISADNDISEHFRVVVLGKPPAFTKLLTTSIGKVRRYLGDVTENDGVLFGGDNLSDAEIQLALDNNGSNEYAAASECCKWIAADWARLPRRITVDSALTIDRADTVKHWKDLAKEFETKAAGGEVGTVALDRRDAYSVAAEKGGHPLDRETDTTFSDS